MIYLLDTNIVSLIVRQDPLILRKLTELNPSDNILIPVTVLGETLFGIQRLPHGQRRDELQRRFDGVLSGIAIQNLPDGAANEYARIKADNRQRARVIGDNDYWIAATAIVLNATLATRDTDFSSIDGLSLDDWSS